MRTIKLIAFSIIAGIALGAGLVEVLHAQSRPQAYVVGEINVTDPESFAKDFSPLARKALAEAPGYRALVLGGKTVAIEGPAPKTRVVILSILDDAQTRGRAQAAGAVAFVEKRGATGTLLSAIRQAAAQAGKSSE